MTQLTSQPNKLIVVGAVHVDDVAHPHDLLVPRASNPVRWTAHVGGVASNAACAARRVETGEVPTQVAFYAAVGSDSTARLLEETLSSVDINTHFQIFDGCQTGRYTAILSEDGELYIGLSDVALAERLGVDKPLEISQIHCVDGLLFDANITQQCASHVVKQAAAANVPVAAMSVSPQKARRLIPMANQLDLLFCNRREALAMLPEFQIESELNLLADGLTRIGFKRFVLTDGSAPLIVQDNNIRITQPITNVESTNSVNGAGDALAGSTFAAWSSGYTLADSVSVFGLEQASRIVRGLQTPLPLHGTASR